MRARRPSRADRKSTRLNSSHLGISYAVFCLKKKISAILLPLFPNLIWMLVSRMLVGLGSGGAFITGAGIASRLGKHASLVQGLDGGATQAGSRLGLLIT